MIRGHSADGVEYCFRADVPTDETIALLESARTAVFGDSFPPAAGIPLVEVSRSQRHVRGWVYSTGSPTDARVRMSLCLPKVHSQRTQRYYDSDRGCMMMTQGLERDPVQVAERLYAVCCHEWGHVREAWEMFGDEMLSQDARKQWYDRKSAYRHVPREDRPWELYAQSVEIEALTLMEQDPALRDLIDAVAGQLALRT